MIKITDKDGKSTPYLSNPPKEKELIRCTIDQLIILAKQKRNFKASLLQFLLNGTKS